MKKILYITAVAGLLSACYEDKGTYDYHFDDVNYIEGISFVPEAFSGIKGLTVEFQQPLDEAKTERVEVQLEQSLSRNFDNLDFWWERTYTKDGEKVKDTLETKGYLDVELAPGKDTEYKVRLRVRDRVSSLARYVNFTISTRPIFRNSLFVLHGNSGGAMQLGNVEFVGDKTVIRMDALKAVQPDAPNAFADAVGLGYNAYYDLKKGASENFCAFRADGQAELYSPFGLKLKKPVGYVMPYAEIPFIYKQMMFAGDTSSSTDYMCMLSQDGRFYISRTFLCFHAPSGVADSNTDYEVRAATISSSSYVGWDERHNRFLHLSKGDDYGWNEDMGRSATMSQQIYDAHVDLSALTADLHPANKDAVYAYIQYRENYDDAHPFFIFKDTDANRYYAYELTPAAGGKDDKKSGLAPILRTRGDDKEEDGDLSDGQPAFSISGKVLRRFQPGNLSAILYNSWFTTNYLFYADGNTVYRYNTADGDKVVLYTAPDGYTVSTMKFRTEDAARFAGDLGRYLMIGMNKDNEGAVAEVKLTTSADLDEEFAPTFYNQDSEGNKFGRIKDLVFAREYLYQKD